MDSSPQCVLDDLDRLTSEYRRQFLLYPAIRLSKLRSGKIPWWFNLIAIIANLLTIAMAIAFFLELDPSIIKMAFRDVCIRLFSQ